MRRGPALLVLATLLAGCASQPPPLEPGEPTFSDADLPRGPGFAPLRWSPVSTGAAALTPATPVQASVAIPNGTLVAFVNLTPQAGGASGLGITLDECVWRRDVIVVGPGEEVAADCGGVADGEATLLLAVRAGALQVEWQVVVLTCDAREGICPARPPVGT